MNPLDMMVAVAGGIALGCVVIAGTLLFVLRWEISANQGGVYRLDRWGGSITVCAVDVANYAPNQPLKMKCDPK